MLIHEFIEQLNKFDKNKTVVVNTVYPSSIAYSPNSPVKGIYQGFDWDSNMVFITTENYLETVPSARKRFYESEIKINVRDVQTNKENIRVHQLDYSINDIIEDLKNRDVTNLSLMQLKEIKDILNQTK